MIVTPTTQTLSQPSNPEAMPSWARSLDNQLYTFSATIEDTEKKGEILFVWSGKTLGFTTTEYYRKDDLSGYEFTGTITPGDKLSENATLEQIETYLLENYGIIVDLSSPRPLEQEG